jgi:hypothetical protein
VKCFSTNPNKIFKKNAIVVMLSRLAIVVGCVLDKVSKFHVHHIPSMPLPRRGTWMDDFLLLPGYV